MMERRKFLTTAAIGGAAAAATAGLSAPAISQGRTEWRMVTCWPKNYPGQGTAAERFVKTISEPTDGRHTINVFGAGGLLSAFNRFDAVTRGAADLVPAST